MDPSSSFLARLLLEEITPVVMVLSTPLAEEACRKNGLSFVQMLHPFTIFNNIDVPVRTASDQPYRLQSFKLRMVYASDISQPNYEAAVNHLKEVVSDASEKTMSDLQSDPPRLEDLLSMSESEVYPLWFHTFNRDLSRAVSFSDHEAFDHPVACLFVVSSKDEQPMNKIADLFSTDQLPSLLNEGAMDPKILKHYLLIHDIQDGTTEKASGILAEMRNAFGLNDCRLLCINSADDEGLEWKDNPWVRLRTDSSPNQDIGHFLSIDDVSEIKELMQDLSSKKIIPHMEQKIRLLNQQVSATRKGFKNQIKNLWWRKGKEEAPDTSNGPSYTFSSIESQIRILGDYAFMLRDYELASSNYRLLSTDYKLDKAWKCYAGVQEMLGISLFMLDQSRKDAEYCMENAFNTYLKLGSSGLRNATRCGLWWAEMLKVRGQHKEAAGVYFRISTEEPSLHAAVMLEQASYCYLFSDPPMLRKFAFHLVLAGNRYYISDQRKHAIRTYRSALSVYKGNAWSYINDHVHFNIGRWYAFLQVFDVAIKHLLEVLECTHQSVATQDFFLKEFLQIVQNRGRNLEVAKLQLPSINMSSLKVHFEDHRTYASSTAVHVRESVWQSLEEDMVPTVTAVKSNWLDSRKFHPSKKYTDGYISVVGEAIKVYLEFKNPLQISIPVSGVSLLCELSAKPTVVEHDDDASENGLQNSVEHGEPSGTRDQNSDIASFDLSEINFVLGGGETRKVQLEVTPKMEGFLKIIGVKWTLLGYVVGYHNFDVDVKKKNRKGRGAGSSLKHKMSFIIVKGLPKLEGSIHHLPKKAYAGELRLLMLELKNQSEYSVKNMKMKISHPRFLTPGRPGDLDLSFPGCLKKQIGSEAMYVQADIMEKPGSLLFSFPSDARIQGGAVFQWPLWLHTAASGNISLYMSIYYEMDNFSCDINYRTLRLHYELEVLPSLDVSVLITPCASKLQEFLVRMEIASRTASENFWLRQLSSVGCQWEISSLPSHASVCPSQLLLAGQALVCFFKLKDCGETSSKERRLSVQGSDVKLGSEEDAETVDISQTPLANFHYHERLQQGNSLQRPPTTVDFILVSNLVANGVNSEPGEKIQLLSHHACHCSVACKSPIWWLMDGPRTIIHDFSTPFCEASFHVTVHNCSEVVASVKISTFDSVASNPGQSRDASPRSDSSANQAGWHEVSLVKDSKVASDVRGDPFERSLESITPFIWCATSTAQVELGPMSAAEVPLRICIFSPGIYDLSNYELHWRLQISDGNGFSKDVTWQPSGVNKGHPFYLTVLQPEQTDSISQTASLTCQ